MLTSGVCSFVVAASAERRSPRQGRRVGGCVSTLLVIGGSSVMRAKVTSELELYASFISRRHTRVLSRNAVQSSLGSCPLINELKVTAHDVLFVG